MLQQCPAVEEEVVDLTALSDALRDSSSIGVLEKVRLRGRIDELLARLRAYHEGRSAKYSLAQLEEQYNVLLMRIAADVQQKDRLLHQQLCNAWLPIWLDLEDGARFEEKFSG